MNKKMQKGFTLVEIMIVVAIIAILAAIAIPNFIAYRNESQGNACVGNMKTIQTAVETYLTKHPGVTTVGAAQLIKSDGTGLLKGKAATDMPKCPKDASAYTITIADNMVSVTCNNHNENGEEKTAVPDEGGSGETD